MAETPREPDRYEEKARELYSHLVQRGGNNREADLTAIAAALCREHDAALDEAAQEYGSEDLANVKVYCRHVAQRLRDLKSPAAAPAAETGKASGGDDVPPVHKDSGGIGNDAFRGASSPEVPAEPALWRVGSHYGIHVYEGQRPVATFHTVLDARRCV
jgi:hypothetical protein